MRHVIGIVLISSSLVLAGELKPTKSGYVIPQYPLINLKRVENHTYYNAKGIYTDTLTLGMGAMPVVVWDSEDYGVYAVTDYVLSLSTAFKNPSGMDNLKQCREMAMKALQDPTRVLVVTPNELVRKTVFFTSEELVKNFLNQQFAFIQARADKKVNNLVSSLYSYWTDPNTPPTTAPQGAGQNGAGKPKMPPLEDLLGNLTELSQQIVLRKSLSQSLDTQAVQCDLTTKEKFLNRLEKLN